MDSFEWNKIAGAVLFALLVAFGLRSFSGLIFNEETPEAPGYVVAVATEGGSGGTEAPAAQPIGVLLASASADAGANVVKKCAACHTFDQGGANKVGPNLWGVVNRPIASHEGYEYDDVMKAFAQQAGTWTFEHLNTFLTDPKATVPGTKMAFAGLKNDKDRANAIAYLRTLSDNPAPLPDAAAAETPAATQVASADASAVPAEAPATEEAPTMNADADTASEEAPATGTEAPGQEMATAAPAPATSAETPAPSSETPAAPAATEAPAAAAPAMSAEAPAAAEAPPAAAETPAAAAPAQESSMAAAESTAAAPAPEAPAMSAEAPAPAAETPAPAAEAAAPAPAEQQMAQTEAAPAVAAPAASGGDAEKGKAYAKRCTVCHSFDQGGPNKVGPHLFGVVGRHVASISDYNYSDAMKAFSDGGAKVWDPATLDTYLTDPRKVVPGTKMVFPGVKDADRANVIAYLETLKE